MLSQATRIRIFKKWDEFINPQNLEAAFFFTVLFLRAAGMYPYAQGENGFEISSVSVALTLIHFSVYLFINTTVLFTDLMSLAKPIIMDTDLGIGANLIIRVVGMVISVAAFVTTFTGIKSLAVLLNRYVVMLDLMEELGIETRRIFKKMFLTTTVASLAVFLISLYLLAHTYFFYERIANEKASMRFFYVVVIANYYQNVCLFAMGNHMFCTYSIQALFNGFITDLLNRQMEQNEAWRRQIKKKISST